jgi:predicted metal-dependent enzyme (double-stranded beta helix superfamily)
LSLINDIRPSLGPGRLSKLVRAAESAGDWRDRVRYSAGERWYQRLELTEDYELWLLSWLPGQHTGFHDHCGSAGAFAVASGELQERTVRLARPSSERTGDSGRSARPRLAVASFTAGAVRSFGPRHVHDVVNDSVIPAVSIHAYSPPLPGMRRYELTAAGLVPAATQTAEESW